MQRFAPFKSRNPESGREYGLCVLAPPYIKQAAKGRFRRLSRSEMSHQTGVAFAYEEVIYFQESLCKSITEKF
ncbi:hypothetical protein J14TS5_34410 [Paenibacillus lautus]|nr:hypothetical protein J14TS5_34410 [Paenibacillus lautus]